MSKSRFRRARLPIGIAAVVALGAVGTTVWLGGNANADTTTQDAPSVSVADAAKAARSASAAGAKEARTAPRNLKKARAALDGDVKDFGDITGDGKADLGAVDKTGTLWIYPGTGYVYPGTGVRSRKIFGTRFSVGKGWGAFTTIVRHGDFNGDGKQDLLTRTKAGALFFYAGTGTSPGIVKKGVQVGKSWQSFKSIVGVGDLNGDGKDDLIAQKTTGDLLLYRGTGNGLNPFAPSQTKIGSSFKGSLLTSVGDLTGDGRTELLYRDTSGLVWIYESKAGTLPIGTRDAYIEDASVGKAVKNIVGAGNLESEQDVAPLPDLAWQLVNQLFVVPNDAKTVNDDDTFSIGSGWDPYYLF